MKPLPLTFTKDGFLFTQRQREGNIAIYGKRRPNWRESAETFEVVKIRQCPAREMAGVSIEAMECFPSSETWGVSGWSKPTLEASRAILATLIAEGSSKRLKCLPTPPKNIGLENSLRAL